MTSGLSIIDAPSPNFDARELPVSMIVLHYTGMESAQAAIDRLRDPEAKVSAHYLVDEDGRILQLVDERHRAWHVAFLPQRSESISRATRSAGSVAIRSRTAIRSSSRLIWPVSRSFSVESRAILRSASRSLAGWPRRLRRLSYIG